MNSHLVRKSFNKAAFSYDDSCQLQLQTADDLMDFIKTIHSTYGVILDAGCGTGIVTKKLIEHFNYQTLYAVDIAEDFISLAKTKLSHKNIVLEHIDFNHFSKKPIDLIFSNLALHWSNSLEKTLTHFKSQLSPHGMLCFSIPLLGTFNELNGHCSIQDFYSETSLVKILKNSGFDILVKKNQSYIHQFDNFISALKSIKAVGTNHVSSRTPIAYKAIRNNYENPNPFHLTYHIGYFICQ